MGNVANPLRRFYLNAASFGGVFHLRTGNGLATDLRFGHEFAPVFVLFLIGNLDDLILVGSVKALHKRIPLFRGQILAETKDYILFHGIGKHRYLHRNDHKKGQYRRHVSF